MREFEKISVTHSSSIELLVDNPTGLKLLDKGAHGAVFQLAAGKCIKIYADEENALLESNSYIRSQTSDIVPRLYEAGRNYIIIEFVEGISLWNYLFAEHDISYTTAEKLLQLLKSMKALGFTRIDSSLRHILIKADGSFKVVDLVYAYIREDKYPHKVFTELMELGLLKRFFKHVKKIDSQLHAEWKLAAVKYLSE